VVISTIHAGSTAGVFARLINMELEPFLLASAVVGVLGLRLIRLNCPGCTTPREPDTNHRKHFSEETLATAALRHGAGCNHCVGTGYSGRSALTEMLVVNDPLREAILERMPTRALQDVAVAQGMKPLWNNGLERVLRGETTLEEIQRVLAADAF